MSNVIYLPTSTKKSFFTNISIIIIGTAILSIIGILLFLGAYLIYETFSATEAHAQELAEPQRTNPTSTNICFTDEKTLKTICQKFTAPDITFTPYFPPQYISASPTDPARTPNRIPNYGLAAYHHWIFDTQQKRAQRWYAACIERIKVFQQLMGVPYPELIDSPTSSLYPTIVSLRDYQVPFNAIATTNPERPPTRLEAIEHVKAAVDSNNLIVYHLGLCEAGAYLTYKEYLKYNNNSR